MGYMYNEQTGEKYLSKNYGGLTTREGWCPYYNLKGKYVGAKRGFNFYTGASDYYKPSTRKSVENYEDLDW